jgi:hypothetical protein
MSFQAYLDNIEEKTGRTPREFIAEARKKKLTESRYIIAWLKKDYGLGLGHARALDYVIRRGPHFEVRQKSGPHRDASATLKLDGKSRKKRKTASAEVDFPKLGAPAERALAGAGIKNLRQLSRFSEAEIRQLHGIGPNALGKLHQALTDLGLSFADKNLK